MNTYAVLAWLVDFIHLLLIIYFVAGFFISINRHRTFRLIHSISISALLPIQLLFDFNCPLLVLDGRLRELAYPGITGEWYYKSFFVPLVQYLFGINMPEIIVTVATILGSIIAIITLVHILLSNKDLARQVI
ncbi:MAG: DUF2784 family protein [candidate division NC10 bacterium]|nr:DUF2784 family protein [candidate division NC10 bacterium]